jgi:hypothetical protein
VRRVSIQSVMPVLGRKLRDEQVAADGEVEDRADDVERVDVLVGDGAHVAGPYAVDHLEVGLPGADRYELGHGLGRAEAASRPARRCSSQMTMAPITRTASADSS